MRLRITLAIALMIAATIISCASTGEEILETTKQDRERWDDGFSDEEKVDILILKSDELIRESRRDITTLVTAREYLIRAKRLDPYNLAVLDSIEELEARIAKKKKDEYYAGRRASNRENYIEAAIHLRNAVALHYEDEKDSLTLSAESALERIADDLERDIDVELVEARNAPNNPRGRRNALALYEQILRADPYHVEASDEWEAMAADDRARAQSLYDEAKAEYTKGNFRDAERLLNDAEDIHEMRASAALLVRVKRAREMEGTIRRAEREFARDKYVEAYSLYAEAQANDPGNPFYEEKMEVIRALLDAELAAWYREATMWYNRNNYDRAIELFEQILELDPEYEQAQDYYDRTLTEQADAAD